MAKEWLADAESEFEAMEEEVKGWTLLRDAESDPELWAEYHDGVLDAEERLAAAAQWLEDEQRYFEEADATKERRLAQLAAESAAAAAEAAYEARTGLITDAEETRDGLADELPGI